MVVRGQYNAVQKILDSKNLKNIPLISVSKGKFRNKGREILHLRDRDVNLPLNDALLFFIQRVRDEAHRFAINTHRSRRSKKTLDSVFNELYGVGPKRKKLLMMHFGSVEKIKKASKQELKSVKGLPNTIIDKVYDFFHSH